MNTLNDVTNAADRAAVCQANFELLDAEVFGTNVYRAKLTQFDPETITSGPLRIGETYTITTYLGADDFTNVGAADNIEGTLFVATGTTPAVWDDESVLDSAGNPIPKVAKNTLGGTPVFTREGTGEYTLTLAGAFPDGKTTACLQLGFGGAIHRVEQTDADSFNIRTYVFDAGLVDYAMLDAIDGSFLMIFVDP